MAKTNEPKTDTDRMTITLELPAAMKSTPGVPSLVTTMFVEEMIPGSASFTNTYELRAQATANDKAARAEGKALDEEFDVGLRMFTPTVRDVRGVSAAAELAKMAGGIVPSDLVRRPMNEEHLYTAEILRQVPLRSDLTYDPTRYAELAALHAKLPGMIATLAATALAVKTTTDNHRASRANFDSIYGRFRRVVRAAGGDTLARALLHEFISQDPKGNDDVEETVDDVSDAAGAESSAQSGDSDEVG